MERMWRRVSGKQARKTDVKHEDDLRSDNNLVTTSSSTTGKRLASSGNFSSIKTINARDKNEDLSYINYQKTLSQHVVEKKYNGLERSRRKRYRNRSNRPHGISCVGGNEDMSSSGGFYTINESIPTNTALSSGFVPPGTVLMYPSGTLNASLKKIPKHQLTVEIKKQNQDISIRQRAIAKLRMLNFNLNWDLQLPQCKPCGSATAGKGNIITRRLCRSRGREENELYRSNSFKFERFERKESIEVFAASMQNEIPLCDDYSLPVDFLKKRPHSFEPCLTDNIAIVTETLSSSKQFEKEEERSNFNQISLQSPRLVKYAADIENFEKSKELIPIIGSCHMSRKLSGAEEKLKPDNASEHKEIVKRRKKRRKLKSGFPVTLKVFECNRDKQIHQSQFSDSSIPRSSEEDPQGARESDIDSAETIKDFDPKLKNVKKQKSPYYYSDLMKNKADSDFNKTKLIPETEPRNTEPHFFIDKDAEVLKLCKRYSFTEEGVHIIRCGTPSTTTSEDSNCSQCQNKYQHNKLLQLFRKSLSKKHLKLHDVNNDIDLNGCTCFLTDFVSTYTCQDRLFQCAFCSLKDTDSNSTQLFHIGQEFGKMSVRRRNLYETAFDSKVTKSEDDIIEVDRITNHSLIVLGDNSKNEPINEASKTVSNKNIRNESTGFKINEKGQHSYDLKQLTDNMNNLEIDKSCTKDTSNMPHMFLCSYNLSPPSTAPLPMKFLGKQNTFCDSGVQSTPHLHSKASIGSRIKSLRIPIHDLTYLQEGVLVSGSLTNIDKNLQASSPTNVNEPIQRMSTLHPSRSAHLPKKKTNQRLKTFSSNESIITSSSDGSVESLRSTTSEGNCSSSFSESRRSTSLSSHSSESNVAINLKTPTKVGANRHVLSPISDKSTLEPNIEFLEQSKKPNQTTEVTKDLSFAMDRTERLPQDILKRKKVPSNKFLQNLADELPCSDSGISIHSREDSKNIIETDISANSVNIGENSTKEIEIANGKFLSMRNTSKLVLDIPQVKQKRITNQENFTSGSATSVELGDLPFDMPKLRRKLRANQLQINFRDNTESSGISQASSSHSIHNEKSLKENSLFRRNLTLNFNDCKTSNKFSSLDLKGLTVNKDSSAGSLLQVIDVTVPLERQGWYHGAITRIEAESTLRPLSEGSFLVRNCESAKQDYSLSLKGAKGFMHMRIQRNESGHYVLGQFSRPFDSIPKMIHHFCLNRLPVRGAEHMCLIQPVISQVL